MPRSESSRENLGPAQRRDRVARDEGESRPASSGAPADPALSPASSLVLVARLVRPHGRRGELIADVLTDFPQRFHERARLFLVPPVRVATRPREIELESFWFLRSRIIFKFHGISSINEAESLRGYAVAIPASERMPLEEGAVYLSDLLGCRVFDLNRSGAEVGEIIDVDRASSSTDLLVVRDLERRGSNAEVLIPFVKDYLVSMKIDERRLEMRLPAGLLEINAPMTEEEKRRLADLSSGSAAEDPVGGEPES